MGRFDAQHPKANNGSKTTRNSERNSFKDVLRPVENTKVKYLVDDERLFTCESDVELANEMQKE